MREYGSLNGHLVGIAMKEIVRRALVVIRNHRFTFDVEGKLGYGGAMDDMVTSADHAAQEVYLRSLRECFPGLGIVAEEESLSVPCTLDHRDIFFTVDPLDGTKAFVRRQSFGIGTMLSLVDDGRVVAGYVGDVMTQEIFGYRPGSSKVHRISEFDSAEPLEVDPTRTLASQHMLLRELPDHYSTLGQHLIDYMDGADVSGGSIGTGTARLWKGEVGAMLLPPSWETPWDTAPVLGISERMGLGFYRLSEHGLVRVQIPIGREKMRRDDELLVVHESREAEVNAWMSTMGAE